MAAEGGGSDPTLNLNKVEAEELKEDMYASGQKVAGGEPGCPAMWQPTESQQAGWAVGCGCTAALLTPRPAALTAWQHNCCLPLRKHTSAVHFPPPAATHPYTGEGMAIGTGGFAPAVPPSATAGEGSATGQESMGVARACSSLRLHGRATHSRHAVWLAHHRLPSTILPLSRGA